MSNPDMKTLDDVQGVSVKKFLRSNQSQSILQTLKLDSNGQRTPVKKHNIHIEQVLPMGDAGGYPYPSNYGLGSSISQRKRQHFNKEQRPLSKVNQEIKLPSHSSQGQRNYTAKSVVKNRRIIFAEFNKIQSYEHQHHPHFQSQQQYQQQLRSIENNIEKNKITPNSLKDKYQYPSNQTSSNPVPTQAPSELSTKRYVINVNADEENFKSVVNDGKPQSPFEKYMTDIKTEKGDKPYSNLDKEEIERFNRRLSFKKFNSNRRSLKTLTNSPDTQKVLPKKKKLITKSGTLTLPDREGDPESSNRTLKQRSKSREQILAVNINGSQGEQSIKEQDERLQQKQTANQEPSPFGMFQNRYYSNNFVENAGLLSKDSQNPCSRRFPLTELIDDLRKSLQSKQSQNELSNQMSSKLSNHTFKKIKSINERHMDKYRKSIFSGRESYDDHIYSSERNQ
ncbi:UNKNOWN [Stylonychia lemnae]|uniref:Uncharacterized protein n=1 Tax=Stylonychia lemnae TaxID=5949 RepID=A0A077ZT79_STYLE|nr:UNKNOWN [Stylonychia lemnae]|eukprot:CDW73088.1 UNKNOWN [Stylonychia lemnae]